MMKVGELREALEGLDPEMDVVLSKDSEGNSYSPLYVCDVDMYVPESGCYGYILTEEDFVDDPEWTEDLEYEPNALILWPSN